MLSEHGLDVQTAALKMQKKFPNLKSAHIFRGWFGTLKRDFFFSYSFNLTQLYVLISVRNSCIGPACNILREKGEPSQTTYKRY